ncbi:MAG TPA: phytanoyl-CoA dioxygenase family protein [Myxococcales bacterium]|nr:phytanoyl-CoA dioxygenase family protein [Myxococcales bacterium]
MTFAAVQTAPPGVAGRERFTPAEIEQFRASFERDGYLVVPGALPRSQVEALAAAVLDRFEAARQSGGLFTGGGLLTGHLNCYPGSEARLLYAELESRGLIQVIRALFPKAVGAPNVGCNLNLPGSVVQHYHVDRPYTRDFVIANVALVDTNIANGAIELVPGTQRRFYKYWRFALERPQRNSKRISMQAGDLLVRTSNLWHRGMPNRTGRPRPMLAFTWEDGGSVQPDPFEVEGGGIAFRPNWYRTSFLGRLRERTFLAAPVSYDAWRFVRSLFGTKGYDH